MKCILRAWGQLKSGLEVVALGEMCFESMGADENSASSGTICCVQHFAILP